VCLSRDSAGRLYISLIKARRIQRPKTEWHLVKVRPIVGCKESVDNRALQLQRKRHRGSIFFIRRSIKRTPQLRVPFRLESHLVCCRIGKVLHQGTKVRLRIKGCRYAVGYFVCDGAYGHGECPPNRCESASLEPQPMASSSFTEA
jgi:hypothetical protein